MSEGYWWRLLWCSDPFGFSLILLFNRIFVTFSVLASCWITLFVYHDVCFRISSSCSALWDDNRKQIYGQQVQRHNAQVHELTSSTWMHLQESQHLVTVPWTHHRQTTPSAKRWSLRCDTAGVVLHNQSAGSAADVSEVSADSLRIIDKASVLTGSPDPSDWSVRPPQRSRTTSCSQWVFFFKIKADGNRNQHSSVCASVCQNQGWST